MNIRNALILTLAAIVCPVVQAQTYLLYVANESEDTVSLVSFSANAFKIVETIPVGTILTEIEGPHGLTISPDGQSWFVSMAHGQPFGRVVRYSTEDNRKTGETTVGLFPASMAISNLTGLLHVVNFNLHGPSEPGSISVIDPKVMIEVARTSTGVMPHGSQFAPDGSAHYSVAMMSHELVEQSALDLQVRRRLDLGPGVKPTWVAVAPVEPRAYIAGNGSEEILQVDLHRWEVTGTVAAPGAPYNVALTPDGQTILATLKSARSVGVYSASTLTEKARIPTSEALPHGIAVTPDGLYAFVTSESIGGTPGTVDALDLRQTRNVATIATGQQAGGIVFWKTIP